MLARQLLKGYCMNTGLLINTSVANVGAVPAPPKSSAVKNTRQSTPATPENPAPVSPAGAETTENIHAEAQNTPINTPQQEFCSTLHKKATDETPQKSQANTEPKGQNLASFIATQPGIVQSCLAGSSQNVEHSEEGVARKIEPKARYELAQLLLNLKAHSSELVIGPATTPVEKKPCVTVTVDNGQLGLSTSSPDTPKGPVAPDNQPGDSKNATGAQISDKAPVATKALINLETGKELASEATTVGSKTTIVGDKPAVSSGQKTPVLNDSSAGIESKPSESEPEILVGPKKSIPVAEKPTDNETAGQQGRATVSQNAARWEPGQIHPESSSANGKEVQTDNLPANPRFQKLNVTELQVSTDQTKDRSNSTSGNNSNSDFEQMPSFNDTQLPITEQSSASSGQLAKTVSNAPPDGSTSISDQIQGSISSLLRQGDQQITIRLNPPELGKVFIRFQQQEGEITGLLEVSRAETRVEIQQLLPQIIRNLQDSGVQIKRLEVQLSDQPEQQLFRDQSLQDGSLQQHGFSEGNHSDNTAANEWLTNDSSYSGFTEPEQMLITDNSINMLV